MAEKITQLPKTQFSGLEFTNIMEDIHALVKENPEYNSNWDDFLNSNAGRMLTEVFAWIADQLATRIDWNVNENFIGTATQRSSIIKLLKLIGYKFSLPVASQVPVTIEFSREVGNYEITPTYFEGSGQFFPKTIQGVDKKGNLRNFEAIEYDSANQKYSYKVPVVLDGSSGKAEFYFHEGKTKLKTFYSTSNSGQKFIIEDTPVIANSIVVYQVIQEGTDTREIELLEVNNFLNSKAQKAADESGTNAIPYVTNVREDNSVEIEFGSSTLLPTIDRRLPNGAELRVFYRVGGGIDGNIPRQSINTTEKPNIAGFETVVNYKNLREGIGGTDAESVEHAAYHGPLTIRTGGKTVTPEDYEIQLNAHTSILKSKSYGYNNIPSDYFDKYGTYFNPLDVVNFIVMKKPGWESRPTSKYYLSDWGTFNLENRFNGEYWFSNGDFGNEIEVKDVPVNFSEVYDYDNEGGKEFKNFTILKTPSDFASHIFMEDPEDPENYIANPEMIASITKDQFDKEIHSKLSDLVEHLVHDSNDPYFYGDYNESGFPRIEIREDIQAFFLPIKDITAGLNISTGKNKCILNIDNQGDVTVDFSKGGVSPNIVPLDTQDSPYIEGLVDIINNALASAYSDVRAYQDFGILIEDTTAQVPNLENRDEEDWILRISDINYTVNTGVDQSYDQMMIQINDAINSAGYEAIFIQNKVNITCYDIRVQRTEAGGTVVLEDSNDPYDILVAYEAIPLSTMPVSSGDYSSVATRVDDDLGAHVKLTSPNSGSTSTIIIKDPVDSTQSCLPGLFGLNTESDGVTEYTCYGQQALTVIYRDSDEPDFADFIYEMGTINFSSEIPDIVYLNYVKETKDTIRLGTYFNENFSIEEPEWTEVDKRLYNTQYIVDPLDDEGKRELFDLENSNIVLKFTKDEVKDNSIFTINNDYTLRRATEPIRYSKDLSTFPNCSGKLLTIQINDNAPQVIDCSGITTLDSLILALNTTFNTQANEMYDKDIDFANRVTNQEGEELDQFVLSIDNNKDGKIIIIGETNSANILLFDGLTEEENDVTYANGDYYLKHNQETDTIDMIRVENAELPDVPFYIHYVADRRHEFIDPERDKVHTDEDDLQSYMFPYKVAGVNNIFMRPIFSTFDVKANVFISKAIPKQQVQYNVEVALRDAYSLESADFNTPIIKSEVSKIIMNVPGVRYVEVDYFGTDMSNESTNVASRIQVGFDELMVLSDSIFDSSGAQIHGQNLTYNVI